MSIIDNRKASHDYFIEDRYEAGLVLEGWEVKAIREGRAQLKEGYVTVRDGELFIIGMHISPLPTASTHIRPDATRSRKLLLKAEEISKLIGKVEQRGYALVPLNLHYKNGRIKLDFALGRGKKLYDKRDTAREKDWAREKELIMKHDTRADRKGD
jgi:SsrA-binding protein